MGIIFGFALEKSRVFEPGIIVGQMQLRNFIMLKVFLTAVATGAVVLAVMHGFGFVKLAPKAALYAADIIGGLILGTGIALAGACPGTVMAQVELVTGMRFHAARWSRRGSRLLLRRTDTVEDLLASGAGKLVLSDVLGIPYWSGALALAAICAAILILLERSFPSGGELGGDVDGTFRPPDMKSPSFARCLPNNGIPDFGRLRIFGGALGEPGRQAPLQRRQWARY